MDGDREKERERESLRKPFSCSLSFSDNTTFILYSSGVCVDKKEEERACA